MGLPSRGLCILDLRDTVDLSLHMAELRPFEAWYLCQSSISPSSLSPLLTCAIVVTGHVHLAAEQLQSDDGVDDDHEQDEESDM